MTIILDGERAGALDYADASYEMVVADALAGSPEAQDEIRRRAETETKGIRRVRDTEYWGLPYNTIITPGMKPVGKPRVPSVDAPDTKPVPPRPKHIDTSNLSDEEFDTAFAKIQRDESAWRQDIKAGLSLGEYDPEEAAAAGWLGNEEWKPLPSTLFHVTTAKSAVLKDGLKTRSEIGGTATGLGGGEDDTISFTDDLDTASAIVEGIKGMQDFLDRKRSFLSLMDEARGEINTSAHGPVPKRPFDADFVQSLKSAIGQEGLDRLVNGDDTLRDRYNAYQTFLFWREQAGGPMDPLFFGTDPEALVKIDPDEIAVIEARPRPGAQGYQMGALGEWRTGTGRAVEIVQHRPEVVSAPLPKKMEQSIESHRQELDYLLHTYDAVNREPGTGKRRPLVPGGSRWGHGGVYLSEDTLASDRQHDVDVFEGPFNIYVVDDDEYGAGTIWDGGGVDQEWNALADEIAKRAGYEDNYNVMHLGHQDERGPGQYLIRPWDDRQAFFAEVRTTLESRGFDGIQVGGEIVVWNYDKLRTPSQDNDVRTAFKLPKWRGGTVNAAEEPDTSYRIAHTSPTPDGGSPASDVTMGIFPEDFYTHPNYYSTGDDKSDAESLEALYAIRGKPNAMVTVYRSSPKGTRINPGDWVSLSRTYARGEGLDPTNGDNDLPVHQLRVRAGDLWTDGNSINEFGWHPGVLAPDTVGIDREWPTHEPRPNSVEGYREPKADVFMEDGRTIHVESGGDAVPGGYNGYFVAYDHTTGRKLGYLDYQSATGDDSVLIAMIEVEPKARRQGYAEVLVSRLMAEFPGKRIVAGLQTEDGKAFWDRISERMGWGTGEPTLPLDFRGGTVDASQEMVDDIEALLEPDLTVPASEVPFVDPDSWVSSPGSWRDRGQRYRPDLHIPMSKDDAVYDRDKMFRIPAFEGFLPWGPDPEDMPVVDAGYPAPAIDTDIDAEMIDALSATGDEESPMNNPLNMAYERYGLGVYPDNMKSFVQFELARHMSAACEADPELAAWVDGHDSIGTTQKARQFFSRHVSDYADRISRSARDNETLDDLLNALGLGGSDNSLEDLGLSDDDVLTVNKGVQEWLSDVWQKDGDEVRTTKLRAFAKKTWDAISQDGRDLMERHILESQALYFADDDVTPLLHRMARYSNRDLILLDLVNRHIKTWAGTSMDSDYTSISVQRAVELNFGLTGHASVYDRIKADDVAAANAQYEKNKPFLDAFVRAVYQNTQDFLFSNNVKTVYAMRGVKFNTESTHFTAWYVEQPEHDVIEARVQEEIARQRKESIDAQMADARKDNEPDLDKIEKELGWLFDDAHGPDSAPTQIIRRNLLADELMRQGRVQQQPVSSWSVDINVADEFANNGAGLRLGAYIPASRIWATAFTGLGCLSEKELLVLGGTDEVEITDTRRRSRR